MAIGEPSFKEDYQILFENSLDIIYIVDLNGKFLDVNDIGLNLFGYTREEIPDFSIKDIADEENVRKALDLIKEILEKGKQSERIEFKVRTKNGDQLDIESYGIPLKKAGEFYAILGIAHDISKRKFAEEKLKASEDRYRDLFRNMSSGVAVYEAIDDGNDFIFRDFNRTAGLIDNINKWEVIDKKVTEIFPGVKEFGLFEVFQRVWKTGIPEYHPVSYYKDDRIEGWRENYVYKLFSGEIIAVYEEVSEEKQMEDELRESEEKFRRIAEQSLMGIVLLQDDKIKYVNQAISDIIGYSIEEMMSWDPKDLYVKNIYRDDLPLVIEQAGKKQRGETEGVIPHLSYRVISKSGKIKWVEQYSRTIFYEEKTADFITLVDITDRKETELELQESERTFRELVELLPDIVFESNLENRITYANKAGFEKFGYSHEEFLSGIDLLNTLAPEDRERGANNIKEIFKGAIRGPGEYLMQKKDDEKFYAYLNARPIFREGKVIGMRGIIHDITDNKEAEQKLKESEQKYRDIIKYLDVGYFMGEIKGELLMHNPAINKILGFESSESLIGKEAREFYVNPSEGKKYYTQLISTGRVKNQVITVKRKDGQKRIVQVNAHLIPSQSEEPELVEGTMMDITDKYILEQKVQDSQEKYQLISENVDDLITIINSNLEMDYLNEAAHFKILGYPIEDLIRKNFLSLLRPENSEDSRNMLNQGFDTGEMLQEIQFRHKDGAYIWFETNGKHYIDDSGEEKLILVSREITERKEAEDLLREEEEKFRSMAEQALLGIGIFQDDIIQFANQALADIVEMNVQDILSMPVNKYIKNIHPDDLHFILEQLEVKQSGESEEVTHYNARMITTSGNIKWVEIFSKSIFYRGRSADFITAIDITDKVNAEQKLRESEESYRLLVENQTDMIVETDLEGKFLFVSPSYCEIFGKTEGELLGTSFMPLVHENDRNSTSKSRESLIHPPYRAYHEQRALTKNGWRWIAWSDSALFDSENNIIGGIGVGRDVTERVLAEQALKESEEKYRLISENANDIIVIVNQKTKLEYINEIVTPMMGYAKDEVVGKKAFSFIHPDDMDRTASGIKTAFEVGEEKIDIRVRHKDQHWVWFEVKANKFIDGDGNPKLLVVMRDITERKNAERALKDLNIELEWKIEERTRELKESEEKYRNMINHLDVGFFHTKFSGEILNHNYALSQILGYERKESLVGFKASEFWANPERLKNYTEELKQKEAIKGFIHEAIKKNGEKIILQVDSHLVRDEDKDTLEIEGTVSDITDKFVLEQKYRHLFENSPFAIWLIDLKGTLIDCNSTTNKLLSKYSREDLIGKNFREILDLFASPKRLTSFFQKAFKKLIDEGSIAHNEFQMTKGDGSLIWITIQSTLINLEGEILIQVIIQDITERKNAEQKLKESEEKFRHLFESSPYSIILVDTKGKISDCNLSTERIFGVTKERITGRNYMDLHIQPKEHMSFFVERYKRLFKGELPEPMEFKVAKVDGTPIWINVQDSLVKIGDEMFFQVIIQDISEKKEAEEQIKASEERWRSLVENAPNIISIVDRDTKIQFINRTIPPYTIAETIGKPYTDYLTPEYYDISLDAIEQVFATGDSGYYETKIKIPNGFVWFETYVGPIIHDDEVIAATLINNDITERKKTEQIIKESEERWRSLVENAPNIIIIIDENKNIQFINRTIPPYTIAETIGKNIFEYIFPKYEQNVTDIIDHVFSTGEGDYFEVTIPYSGGIIWFESFVGPIIHEDKVIAVTLIASDITERKNSEQMIRESEERFRHLFEMSPMGIFLTDSKGELIDCNTRTTDLLGFEREELIGRGYLEMLSLVKAQELTSLFEDRSKKLFQGEFVDSIELPCYRKDGSLIWVQMHSSLIKVGKEPIMQVILEDITTRKKAEKNLRKSEESLRELNKQLEAKVEERTKELKMSEKKFRQIFESIPDLFFLVDNTSLILDYRGKEEDLYLPPSEFLKRKMADLIPPELGKKEIEAIKKTIETKEPQIFEYILPVKGIEQYYEARHLYFSRNQVAIFIRNITDRKLAEIKLKESEETYRTLVQTSPDAITVTDLRGKIIEVSQKAVEFYRAGSPEELIGLNSFDFIAPEEREQASEVLLLTLKEGITTNKEYTLVRKDGSTYIGELNASIINDAYGNPKAFIATIRDISDRKEAERQIKESEEKYRNLFEDSPLSIVLIDNKGTMIDCNSATFDLFGYEKDELIGKNYLDMLQSYTEESIPQIRTRQELMKRGITPVPQEFQIFKKNKEMIWVLSQVNSLQLGGETHYLAIIQDINERKLAEQILKESEEKLRQQNIELRRIDELKNDFITIAAHELKTPLVSISGYTDFILSHRKDLDSEIREDLTIVQKNSTRLQVLINQLLDVMQIDAKKMDLQRKPVSIREIIENSIEELSYLVKEKSANISIGVREDLQLSVDSLRIMQLFSNLLSNALKFVSNGGKIDITVEKGVTHYVFKVKDDGKGLARNELERIFQKFERIEADKDKGIEKHRGLGLGLYIAKGIVEAHGGKIWASSTGRGKGAEFYFSLPI